MAQAILAPSSIFHPLSSCSNQRVRMNAWASRVLSCTVLALAVTGCTKQRSTMGPPPQVNPPPAVEANAAVRVDELAGLSKRFTETAARLPGRTPEEDREALRQAFTDL